MSSRRTGPHSDVLDQLADATGVTVDDVQFVPGEPVWSGPFLVDQIAVGCVAAATAAIADLAATRGLKQTSLVEVDERHAALSFLTEGLLKTEGWTLPPLWEPLSGDYKTSDGWIRLHTNYPHHRSAALKALGISDNPNLTKEDIALRVVEWDSNDLETAIVSANGVAGKKRSLEQWQQHLAGKAVRAEPLLESKQLEADIAPLPPADRPLSGVRVLDLTRVISGPVATGILAAWGADVLRIDPPRFVEVPALVPVTTSGKRTATLDFNRSSDRQQFIDLLASTDVIIHGYRADALNQIGLNPDSWPQIRPGLVDVSLNAYGWTGPWTGRRGFDSIVQHSVGITTEGQNARYAQQPIPLPCQALDHGCGWLLATAAAAGLSKRNRTGNGTRYRTSLARFAELVLDLPRTENLNRPKPQLNQFTVKASTAWGDLYRLSWPGTIGTLIPEVGKSVPIGSHPPTWK